MRLNRIAVLDLDVIVAGRTQEVCRLIWSSGQPEYRVSQANWQPEKSGPLSRLCTVVQNLIKPLPKQTELIDYQPRDAFDHIGETQFGTKRGQRSEKEEDSHMNKYILNLSLIHI